MYLLGVLLYLSVIIFLAFIGSSTSALFDLISFMYVTGACCATLIAIKGFEDFKYGIKIVFSKDKRVDVQAVENSIEVFTHLYRASLFAGIVGTLIQLIIILKKAPDFISLESSLSVALLTIVYGCIFSFVIIVPILFRLKKIKRG